MQKINYKSYDIVQADNGHISIFKDHQLVAHSELNTKTSKAELRSKLESYLELIKIIEEMEGDE